MKTSVIGRVLGRVEGESKVTGNSAYSADIMRPDTLWAGFLRSPYPHARVVRIDASRLTSWPFGPFARPHAGWPLYSRLRTARAIIFPERIRCRSSESTLARASTLSSADGELSLL